MAEGEYLVLCGPSGCCKTTLLKQAKRELRPAGSREGQVLYQNTPVDMLDAEMAFTEIGYVQQNPEDQIVTDFVWHELAFGLENLALPTKVIRRRVAEMAAFFGMEPWFRKKTSELSGGQKQMLNLASVMAMNPKLLILDEPTSMLDPLAARSLLDTVERINRELGVAVLLTEHRLDAVFPVAIGCWSWTVESSALTARRKNCRAIGARKRKRNACIMDFPPRYASAASLARTPFP